jgi:hypothetical protein
MPRFLSRLKILATPAVAGTGVASAGIETEVGPVDSFEGVIVDLFSICQQAN